MWIQETDFICFLYFFRGGVKILLFFDENC